MTTKNQHASGFAPLITVLSIGLAVAVLYFAKEILLPVALAAFLCFILTPLVNWLERRRLGRIPAVIVVTLLAFSVIGSVSWLAGRQVVELSHQLPKYKDNLIVKIRSIRGAAGGDLEKAKQALEDIGEEWANTDDEESSPKPAENDLPFVLQQADLALLPGLQPEPQPDPEPARRKSRNADVLAVKVVELPPSPLSQILTWLGPLVAPLVNAGIVIVLVIVMLLKREDLRNRLIQLLGTSRLYATTEAIDDATRRLGKFLRMQLLINVIYGVAVAAGLSALGVPNALLWGVLGILLRFLPYVGPWISAVMPIALSFAVSRDWTYPLLTVGLFLLLELIVNNLLEPWLYGSSAGVSSFGVMVAAIFWAWLWGPIGLVLAMPLTVCLVVLGKYVPQLSFLPILFGDRSTLLPHENLYQRLLSADDLEVSRLVQQHLAKSSVARTYDELLIPALRLAEHDRHAGLLSEAQEALVVDATRDLVDELGEVQAKSDRKPEEGPRTTSGSVLCIPVCDRADETVAEMIGQVLTSAGLHVELGSLSTLISETMQRIEAEKIRVVVLTALPPRGSRNTRFLCKRLRQHNSELRIIVALLDGGNLKRTQQRLLDAGANNVATNLPDTIAAVRESCALDASTGNVAPPPHVSFATEPAPA